MKKAEWVLLFLTVLDSHVDDKKRSIIDTRIEYFLRIEMIFFPQNNKAANTIHGVCKQGKS